MRAHTSTYSLIPSAGENAKTWRVRTRVKDLLSGYLARHAALPISFGLLRYSGKSSGLQGRSGT